MCHNQHTQYLICVIDGCAQSQDGSKDLIKYNCHYWCDSMIGVRWKGAEGIYLSIRVVQLLHMSRQLPIIKSNFLQQMRLGTCPQLIDISSKIATNLHPTQLQAVLGQQYTNTQNAEYLHSYLAQNVLIGEKKKLLNRFTQLANFALTRLELYQIYHIQELYQIYHMQNR